MNRLTKFAFFLLSSASVSAQDAHRAVEDFLSLADKWKHTRLDVTYMEILVQHPAVQAVLFNESAATTTELQRSAAEKAVGIDYFRLISCDQQFAQAAVRAIPNDSKQIIKSALSHANNGQQYHSWSYSPKEVKDLFSAPPKARSEYTTKSQSGIPVPDRIRPWGSVVSKMHEALGDLDAVDHAKVVWKIRDKNTLTCNTERNGARFELTMAKTFNAWVPMELVGFLENGKRRTRTTFAYQPVELEGSQPPYPKVIFTTKELNRDGIYLPYIAFRTICESPTSISEDEMAAWMTLEVPPLIAPDAISRLSKQSESLLHEGEP
jgi:hypothetical protein